MQVWLAGHPKGCALCELNLVQGNTKLCKSKPEALCREEVPEEGLLAKWPEGEASGPIKKVMSLLSSHPSPCPSLCLTADMFMLSSIPKRSIAVSADRLSAFLSSSCAPVRDTNSLGHLPCGGLIRSAGEEMTWGERKIPPAEMKSSLAQAQTALHSHFHFHPLS